MENLKNNEQIVLQTERQDAKLRFQLNEHNAEEYLESTALVKDKPWSEEDVEQTKRFLLACAPFAHPKVFPSYWEHLIIASLYGKELARRTKNSDFDPYEAQTLMLLHDLGRLVAPHRYLRNDVIEYSLLKHAGERADLLKTSFILPELIGVKVPGIPETQKPFTKLADMTLAQRIIDVADNLSKRTATGQLWTINDLLDYSAKMVANYSAEGKIWASERTGLKAIADPPAGKGKLRFAAHLVIEEVAWLKQAYGIDFDKLRDKITQEWNNRENQEFLLALKDAQETLDQNVDRLLGKPNITTVVFDVGDVLFQGKKSEVLDDELIRRISAFFSCSPENTLTAFRTLHVKGMTGQISEREYLEHFWKIAGKTPPDGIKELRVPFLHPDVYQPNREMQDIVKNLSQNPNLTIFLFSNVVSVLTPVVIACLKEFYPEISESNYLFSNRIGVAKGVDDKAAFQLVLEIIHPDDPQKILFIDDNEKYTTAARSLYNIRGFTFRENPYRDQTADKRFKQELQKAELIS
ncbi:hypothetical protein HY404_00910 [Candidatus Microgenomates bacterium]|nr:hypothetical protein [Candidatus Microgenomates bacterium]